MLKFQILFGFSSLLIILWFFPEYIQDAYAASIPLDATSCQSFGGTWNSTTTTCTTSGADVISISDEFFIPAGITLFIGNSNGTSITNNGIINNNGTIFIANSDISKSALANNNIITNNGQIIISNGTTWPGINNTGYIVNNNSITISKFDGYGIVNTFGTIDNNQGGQITMSNPEATGIFNSFGTINNNQGGQITISNLAGLGILNSFGTINNNQGGQITISNPAGFGIYNYGGIINNNQGGQITISNNGDFGIENYGTIHNSGIIVISKTGLFVGLINDFGTITNDKEGQIVILYTGFPGIDNHFGTITNSGTITNNGTIINNGNFTNQCSGIYYGTQPTGNTIVDQSPPIIGDWIISSNCSIFRTLTTPENVNVQNNAIVIIENSGNLDIDFANNFLLVHNGSKVIVKSGGKIN